MPAPRKPGRRLRGTYKRTQAAPELVYSQPAAGELNDEQRALLKVRPKELSQRQKLAYGRQVRLAPWLTLGDRELLILWVRAADLYRSASAAFGRCLEDPEFANPASAVAKTGAVYNRLVHRQAMMMINVGHKLGFSPAGRLALGIETRKAAPPPGDDDPWAALRLVPGGKP